MKRVAITGLGIVSPAGSDIDQFWHTICHGPSAIKMSSDLPPGLNDRPLAQLDGFDPDAHFDRRIKPSIDRFSQLAIVAARQARDDSGLALTGCAAERTAVVVGTGIGGMGTLDEGFYRLYGQGQPKLHPMTLPRIMPSAAASQVSMSLGLKGPTYAVASACASGTQAIGQAARMIRHGDATFAVAGGAEACLTPGTLRAWDALRVLSNDTCRPFSRNRCGLVLGEGAAMLLLEEFDHARSRGATIYAELCGYGTTADAGDLTSPDPAGAARAMSLALADAQCMPSDIGYINAHGTGTVLNDSSETHAIRTVFASPPPTSSIKGATGHALGAAGAIEAVATALSLRKQVLPPTLNFEVRDPACDLDIIADGPRSTTFTKALSNSFAFGGINAVIVLSRHLADA